MREGGAEVERYAYDRAGNMVRKTVRGKTTTYTFDGANQLVSSTSDGVTVRYAYDAAGRLVREGGKTYRYGYLDKVLSGTEGGRTFRYAYHVDGQLATADYGDGRAERFAWDGLALVRRGGESFICEPHVGGGNPIVSSSGTAYLNDMLGTTVCVREGRASSRPKPSGKCAAALTAFGEPLPGEGGGAFFTGKPQVEGLGYAFLYRNYRADLAKWQTADPLGYPDGWNQFAYGVNSPLEGVDYSGAYWHYFSSGFFESCDDIVYLLGPGLPLDVDLRNLVQISGSLFQVIAQLLADDIQGDIMQIGLSDLYGLYSDAELNGLGSNPLEPSDSECLGKARSIVAGLDYSDLSIVNKELLSVSYAADKDLPNLIKVNRMTATWLVHFKCWIREPE